MKNKETPLERSLRNASENPGLRPEFYKRLLDSSVLVMVMRRPEQFGANTVAAGSNLNVITLVKNDGVGVIPFFTSPARVFEVSPQGETCVCMTVRELFESRPDMFFHLNPYSKYGREFSPPEVESLLTTGGIVFPQHIHIPLEENVDLRTPENPPNEILDALQTAFARNLEIRAAYVAELHRKGPDPKNTLLLLLDLTESADEERALREAGTVITEYNAPGMTTFDLGILTRDDSMIMKYFREKARPFYEVGIVGRLLQT